MNNNTITFIARFSFKQIKAALKEDETILLGKKGKVVDVSRSIYDLVQSGIKGVLKKDALLTALAELTVSVNIQSIGSCMSSSSN